MAKYDKLERPYLPRATVVGDVSEGPRKLKWWVYTPEEEEAFRVAVAASPYPARIGRVWHGMGNRIYWVCNECMEALITRQPGWQDIEPGGCASSLADGNKYIKAHYRGGSCVARNRRG